MKNSNFAIFLVLVIVAVGIISVLVDNYRRSGLTTLHREIRCDSDVIDESILSLDADTTLFGAFVNFDHLSEAVIDEVANLGVEMNTASQIFDISPNVYAQIPTASLCDLAAIPSVNSIFIPGQESEETETSIQ